jgi:hypothetical protein
MNWNLDVLHLNSQQLHFATKSWLTILAECSVAFLRDGEPVATRETDGPEHLGALLVIIAEDLLQDRDHNSLYRPRRASVIVG